VNLLNMLPSLTPISLMPARQRSGAGTTNGTGQDVSNLEGHAIAILDVTAESGTSPTLDVKLQESDTVGGTYTDIVGAAFTQVTTVSGLQKLALEIQMTKKFVRAVGTAGGTSPVYGWGVQLLGVKKY
jgi:hypothetical protein